MGAEDQRDFVDFFGIKHVDWKVTFGKFVNHQLELTMNYIHIDCACVDSTQATAATTGYSIDVEFLFPHHIKKQYFIEGVIEGEFTVACDGGSSEITDYRISVWKTNDDTTYERLGVTYVSGSEWISVCDTLSWDAGNSIGQERRYHWFIDCWTAQELKEKDRIFLKIEIRGSNDKLYLMHANDPDWEDVWIKIPFRL